MSQLTTAQWRKLGKAKLDEAELLHNGMMYEGAIYLCGYALEFFLKGTICKTLNFTSGYPANRLKFLKTHNLDELLGMSGLDEIVRSSHMTDWSLVLKWNPEKRYDITAASEVEARELIDAVKRLMGKL